MSCCTISVMTVVFCEGMRFLTEERRVPKDSLMREFSFRLPRREVRLEEMDWNPRKR